MTGTKVDPHFFDCPSCKAFATLRLLGFGKRKRRREYECSQCRARFGADALESESAKRLRG
jgi:transposase-like protein